MCFEAGISGKERGVVVGVMCGLLGAGEELLLGG
jgi:hypothetical protein